MVITNSPSVLVNKDIHFQVARQFKILANPSRLKILSALESGSMSFTELMKTVAVNPKTLSAGLNLMVGSGLVRKSYPHQVYVVTPLGRRMIREHILPLQELLRTTLGPERGSS